MCAASLLSRYGSIEEFPDEVLGERRQLALLFKTLATLRTDAPLFERVEELGWKGHFQFLNRIQAYPGTPLYDQTFAAPFGRRASPMRSLAASACVSARVAPARPPGGPR